MFLHMLFETKLFVWLLVGEGKWFFRRLPVSIIQRIDLSREKKEKKSSTAKKPRIRKKSTMSRA